MATTKKAPTKKTAARKAPARKTTAKRTAPRKSVASKANAPKLKQSAERALNIYLGVIGKGFDALQEKIESVRKDSDKRVQEFQTEDEFNATLNDSIQSIYEASAT